MFLPACALAALELGDGRWLRWLQETLEIDLYFSISYGFICKVFRIIILSRFVYYFLRMLLLVT
jgi:hypothetical protein